MSRLRPLTVDSLSTEGLLLLEEGHCLRNQALALCGGMGAAERHHATGLETLRHMVAAGAGYSIVPALAAMPHAMLDGLVSYTPFDDADAGRSIALVWRTRVVSRVMVQPAVAETLAQRAHSTLASGRLRRRSSTNHAR